METTESPATNTHKDSETKRPSLFKRFRRSFTMVFRRKTVRKRTKSESHIPVKQDPRPSSDEIQKRRNSSTTIPADDGNDARESTQSAETKFRPPVKAKLFATNFTSELKQSLQLRSKKIEEGDKSPSEAVEKIEKQRILSSIVDDEKCDVKIETETKTFEEKVALFERQISAGNSVTDNGKLQKSENSDFIDGENMDNSLKEIGNDNDQVENVDDRTESCHKQLEIMKKKENKVETVEPCIKEPEIKETNKYAEERQEAEDEKNKVEHIDSIGNENSIHLNFQSVNAEISMDGADNNIYYEIKHDEEKKVFSEESFETPEKNAVDEVNALSEQDISSEKEKHDGENKESLTNLDLNQDQSTKIVTNDVFQKEDSNQGQRDTESKRYSEEHVDIDIKSSVEVSDNQEHPEENASQEDQNHLTKNDCVDERNERYLIGQRSNEGNADYDQNSVSSEERITNVDKSEDIIVNKCYENYETLDCSEKINSSDDIQEIDIRKCEERYESFDRKIYCEEEVDSENKSSNNVHEEMKRNKCHKDTAVCNTMDIRRAERCVPKINIDDAMVVTVNIDCDNKDEKKSEEKGKVTAGVYTSASGIDYLTEDIKYTIDTVDQTADNMCSGTSVTTSCAGQQVLGEQVQKYSDEITLVEVIRKQRAVSPQRILKNATEVIEGDIYLHFDLKTDDNLPNVEGSSK